MKASDLLNRLVDELCWDLANEKHRYGPEGIETVRQLRVTQPDCGCAEIITHGGQVFQIQVELLRNV